MHVLNVLMLGSALSVVGLSLAAPTPTLQEPRDACSTGVSAARYAQIRNAFVSSGVVPTLIPDIQPRLEVSVRYGNKAVNLGNQFVTTETVNQPQLSFNAEAGFDPARTKYSYFLVDPDVPNPDSPVRANYLHWLVSGAQPDCITPQSPRTVASYQALTPASPQQHRYTFLVYREPAGYQPDVVVPNTRTPFDLNAYVARGGLTLVGGNFLREAVTNGIVTK